MLKNTKPNLISGITNSKRASFLSVLSLIFMVFLSGCSTYETRPQARVPAVPLPEVVRPQVTPTKKVAVKPRTQVKPRPYVAKVERYTEQASKPVITQKEVQTVLKSDSNVDKPVETKSEPSPYETIPDRNISSTQQESSPAVKSLMVRARADMAIGREQSAATKIERALRIEPQNPSLWYFLAKAHHSLGEHQQAISMAKKAISFSGNNESLISKSWNLVKKSGESSGDTMAVKEAINYSKFNP